MNKLLYLCHPLVLSSPKIILLYVSKLHIVLGKLLTNLTSRDNNAKLAPELLCRAHVSSLVISVLCLRTVGSLAYTGNSSNRTNYMRVYPGKSRKILNYVLQLDAFCIKSFVFLFDLFTTLFIKRTG